MGMIVGCEGIPGCVRETEELTNATVHMSPGGGWVEYTGNFGMYSTPTQQFPVPWTPVPLKKVTINETPEKVEPWTL